MPGQRQGPPSFPRNEVHCCISIHRSGVDPLRRVLEMGSTRKAGVIDTRYIETENLGYMRENFGVK